MDAQISLHLQVGTVTLDKDGSQRCTRVHSLYTLPLMCTWYTHWTSGVHIRVLDNTVAASIAFLKEGESGSLRHMVDHASPRRWSAARLRGPLQGRLGRPLDTLTPSCRGNDDGPKSSNVSAQTPEKWYHTSPAAMRLPPDFCTLWSDALRS